MLNEEQIKKLQPLTKHPKYGKLLQSAISGWRKVNPTQWNMGIKKLNGQFERLKNRSGCCLIGAAILHKKYAKTRKPTDFLIANEIEKRFKISEYDRISLTYGFDNFDNTNSNLEAWTFANEVSKIVC